MTNKKNKIMLWMKKLCLKQINNKTFYLLNCNKKNKISSKNFKKKKNNLLK